MTDFHEFPPGCHASTR